MQNFYCFIEWAKLKFFYLKSGPECIKAILKSRIGELSGVLSGMPPSNIFVLL